MNRLVKLFSLMLFLIAFLSCKTPSNKDRINVLGDSLSILNESIVDNDNPILSNPVDDPTPDALLTIEHDPDRLSSCIDSIWTCQKVIDKNNEVINLSGGDRKLTLLIADGESAIYVKLSEDNGMNYVTYWTFIVEPANDYRISFYDVLEDENIDFGSWSQK